MPPRVKSRYRRRHFIRQYREHRGLSQEQLAERMGTTKANISRVENYRQGYTQDFLEAAADAMQTDPASLLNRPPDTPDPLQQLLDLARDLQRDRN
jgi:transcriptional regulator with XRE-family HTH domain